MTDSACLQHTASTGDRFIFQTIVKPHKAGNIMTADGKLLAQHKRFPNEDLPARLKVLQKHRINTHKKSPRSPDLRLFHFTSGAPGGIRTHDPCLRRAVLYPAELRMLVRATSYPCRPDASIPAFAPPPVVHFRQKMANCHPHSQLPAPHVPLFALLLWLYTASTPQFLR